MAKNKSLIYETVEQLNSLTAFGIKKTKDDGKIHSYKTYDAYKQTGCEFAKWVRQNHNVKTLGDAKAYVPEYLQSRMDDNKSAWTINKDAAALKKIYGIDHKDLNVNLPQRHRADVTRSRQDKHIGHFSEAKNADLRDFCKASGLRRHELLQLRPQDVFKGEDGKINIHTIGKGGKERIVTCLNDTPYKIASACKGDKVFSHISKYAPIHGWRSDYATDFYRQIARPVDELHGHDRYICRADKAGIIYDRSAMRVVSNSLGHNRVDVIALSYLR